MEEIPPIVSPNIPPEIQIKSINPWFRIALFACLGLILVGGLVFAGYQLGKTKTQPSSQLLPAPITVVSPIPTPTIVITSTPDSTADWKTYTNNVYSYTINYPPNFKIGLCKDCNPPEIGVSLENDDKTISIGIEYAHQFTLCANSPSPCIPAKNLKINIIGKEYTHEEYYIDYYKNYIFKIENIERNRRSSQISISGTYNNVSDTKLINQILSTFKFLDQPQADETANWKTYTNTKYGYGLKYPLNWTEVPCQGGTLSNNYFCLLSPDFEGSLDGSLLKGGRIDLSINDGKNAPIQPNCPENINGYKFPCSEIQVADFKGWRSVIPESSSKIPTYPIKQNTTYFISNIVEGKQFLFLAEYNKESRSITQSIFDQILSTFKF